MSGPAGGNHLLARELDLPADPASPRAARRFVDDVCAAWSLPDAAGAARFAASELVTNAVLHARTPCLLTLTRHPEGLLVEVRDGLVGPVPRPRPRPVGGEAGRGLQMVAAVATATGGTVHRDGKSVWALLPIAGF